MRDIVMVEPVDYAEKLQALRADVDIIPDELAATKSFFKLFPFLLGISSSLERAGLSVSKLVAFFESNQAATSTAKAFQVTGAALSFFDWLRIPFSYACYRLAGRPYPFSFSRGVKWSYSLILLTLAAAGLLFTVAALPIAIATAALVTASSTLLLVKHALARSKAFDTAIQLKNWKDKKESLERKLNQIRFEGVRLEQHEPLSEADKQAILALSKKKEQLINKLQYLTNKIHVTEKKQKLLESGTTVDRMAGLTFSTIALIGLATALASPPVGLTLLATASVGGLVYVGGRLGLKVASWVKSKLSKRKNIDSPQNTKSEQQEEASDSDDFSVHESMRTIADRLFADPHAALQEISNRQFNINQRAKKIEARVGMITRDKDHHAALVFMKNVAQRLVPEFPPDGLREFFSSIDGFHEVIPILQQAIDKCLAGELSISEDELNSLKSIAPVGKYIQEKELNMSQSSNALEHLITRHQQIENDSVEQDAEGEGEEGPHVH